MYFLSPNNWEIRKLNWLLSCFLLSSLWSCTVSFAALCQALVRCWDKPPEDRLTALHASGGWIMHRRVALKMTWDTEPPWESSRTPASPCCCRNLSTSLVKGTTQFMLCGGPCETWGKMERALFTTCCDRQQWTILMHASMLPQRTEWTTVTWSSRRKLEKTGESLHSFLKLLATALQHPPTELK